jgi:hypothetical protein
VAIENGYVPLNVGAKFRIVTSFRAAKGAVGHVEIERWMLGHAAKNRRHVLNGMGRNGEDAVAAVRHSEPLRCRRNTRPSCGSLSASTRCPEVEYNPFPDMGACAKLPWVRRVFCGPP